MSVCVVCFDLTSRLPPQSPILYPELNDSFFVISPGVSEDCQNAVNLQLDAAVAAGKTVECWWLIDEHTLTNARDNARADANILFRRQFHVTRIIALCDAESQKDGGSCSWSSSKCEPGPAVGQTDPHVEGHGLLAASG